MDQPVAQQQYHEFPPVGDSPVDPQAQSSPTQSGGREQDKKGFVNAVYANDSITDCSGFINDIRSHSKDGETYYFVRAGLIQGSKRNERGDWEGDITNCDLLVGSTLKKWAESMLKITDPMTGIRLRFAVKNLKFTPDIYEGKPVLRSRGVLETITVGHID